MTAPPVLPASPHNHPDSRAEAVASLAPLRLSRYRMRTDRPGLNLRAGEIVLCAPYEPAQLNMLVLVRCEADGHSPGALLSVSEVEYLEPTPELLGRVRGVGPVSGPEPTSPTPHQRSPGARRGATIVAGPRHVQHAFWPWSFGLLRDIGCVESGYTQRHRAPRSALARDKRAPDSSWRLHGRHVFRTVPPHFALHMAG